MKQDTDRDRMEEKKKKDNKKYRTQWTNNAKKVGRGKTKTEVKNDWCSMFNEQGCVFCYALSVYCLSCSTRFSFLVSLPFQFFLLVQIK